VGDSVGTRPAPRAPDAAQERLARLSRQLRRCAPACVRPELLQVSRGTNGPECYPAPFRRRRDGDVERSLPSSAWPGAGCPRSRSTVGVAAAGRAWTRGPHGRWTRCVPVVISEGVRVGAETGTRGRPGSRLSGSSCIRSGCMMPHPASIRAYAAHVPANVRTLRLRNRRRGRGHRDPSRTPTTAHRPGCPRDVGASAGTGRPRGALGGHPGARRA
jgi:hypothetical protein